MSFLLQKSSQNQTAALFLWGEKKIYAPAIHCAYYSCIQLMIHILFTDGGYNQKNIELTIQASYNGNSHVCYIKETGKLVHGKARNKYEKFNSLMKDLKAYREQSDYKDVEITSDDANNATSNSGDINTLLKNIFGII